MQCHYLLKGIAEVIDQDKSIEERQRYLYFAQKLFDFAFNKNKGSSPPMRVYVPYIHIFAKMGDYETCMEFIQCMKDNEDYPDPDAWCCCTALTSLRYFNRNHYDRMDILQQREYIEDIVAVMASCDIERNEAVSFVLMQIYAQHRDPEMVRRVYEQMESKTRRNVTGMARNIVDSLKWSAQNGQEIDAEKYRVWITEEFSKHIAVPLTERQETIDRFDRELQHKISQI